MRGGCSLHLLGGMMAIGCGRLDFDASSDDALAIQASARLNVNGRTTIGATGGAAPYDFTIVSGDATLDRTSGEFVAPNYAQPITVRVTDAANAISEATLTVGGTSLYVLGGWGGYTTDRVYRTTDGSAWQLTTLPTGRGETVSVVWNDQLFLVGGWFSGSNIPSVLSTVDGSAWTSAGTLPSERGWGGAVGYRGRLYYAGGRSNAKWANREVFASDDGVTWTIVGSLPEPTTWGGLATFRDRLWYFGGDHEPVSDAIYSSTDGAAWTIHPQRLPAPRAGGAILVFHSRLWYLGGSDASGAASDQIWASDDGLTWSVVGTLPIKVMNAATTVHDGQLWLIGGNNGPYLGSVFSSADGLAWTRHTDLPETLDRFAAISFTPLP